MVVSYIECGYFCRFQSDDRTEKAEAANGSVEHPVGRYHGVGKLNAVVRQHKCTQQLTGATSKHVVRRNCLGRYLTNITSEVTVFCREIHCMIAARLQYIFGSASRPDFDASKLAGQTYK